MGQQMEASLAKWGLVPLRIALGAVFMAHGGTKAFTMGIAGTVHWFAQMGIPLPSVAGPLVMAVELLGGLAVLTGFLTRWVALALAIDMAVATLMVRIQGGFFAPKGAEFEITLCLAALTLAMLGAGGVSVDAMRTQRDA